MTAGVAIDLQANNSGVVCLLDRNNGNTSNEPRKPWSINVLMDNGQGFFPDFIVGIRERPTEDNGLLTDPKEAYTRTKELPKLAAAHLAYGKVLILTKENETKRWEIATWDDTGERPVIAGPFRLTDAAGY